MYTKGPTVLISVWPSHYSDLSVCRVADACRVAAQLDGVHYHEFLKPPTILKLSRQLLKAAACMHKCGYVHGGKIMPLRLKILLEMAADVVADISAKNIAFSSVRASRLGHEGFFRMIGTPETEVLT